MKFTDEDYAILSVRLDPIVCLCNFDDWAQEVKDSEAYKDLAKRLRWDLLHMGQSRIPIETRFDLLAPYYDDHIDTALRKYVTDLHKLAT